MSELISRQAAIDAIREMQPELFSAYQHNAYLDKQGALIRLMALPSAQTEIKPIEYRDCANAMLRMWMDNVVTDGEYKRIMDKLNAHFAQTAERI